jgi:hypothetical protein
MLGAFAQLQLLKSIINSIPDRQPGESEYPFSVDHCF